MNREVFKINLFDKTKIIVDSTVDLDKKYLTENNISLAYLSIIDNRTNKEYLDDSLSNEELIELFEQGHRIMTSAPSIGYGMDQFEKFLDEYEHVIRITMSSKMSGSYNFAEMAKNEIDNERIIVIDSKQVTQGLQMLVFNIMDYLKKMNDLNEFLHQVESDTSKIVMRGVLYTLKYAILGGRLKQFLGENMAKIIDKPAELAFSAADALGLRYIVQTKNGDLIKEHIKRGKTLKVATEDFNNILSKNIDNIDLNRIVFGATTDMSDLDQLISSNSFDVFDNIEKTQAGLVTTSHVGPKVLSMAYMQK